MDKVRAFKNELRNYKYYKACVPNYEEAIEDKDLSILESFNPALKDIDLKIEEVWVQMEGVHAIRYDKIPSTPNEQQAHSLKLDLIEQYNKLLDVQKKELAIAIKNCKLEIDRIKKNILKIQNVMDMMPKDISKACASVYINDRTYSQVVNSNDVYWSEGGLFKAIERELEKLL